MTPPMPSSSSTTTTTTTTTAPIGSPRAGAGPRGDGTAALPVPEPLRTVRYSAKLFIDPPEPAPDVAQLIPVFHRAIRERALPGLLIDVADYKHVQGGPGVMLIAHEANYALDLASPGPGIQVALKRDLPDDPEARFRWLLGAVEAAARLLEADDGLDLRFDRSKLLFRIQDRLVAPAVPATFEAVAPVVGAWAEAAYGRAPTHLRGADEPGRAFGMWLTIPKD